MIDLPKIDAKVHILDTVHAPHSLEDFALGFAYLLRFRLDFLLAHRSEFEGDLYVLYCDDVVLEVSQVFCDESLILFERSVFLHLVEFEERVVSVSSCAALFGAKFNGNRIVVELSEFFVRLVVSFERLLYEFLNHLVHFLAF